MQDVGDCKSGMAVCQSDGMTLGACAGDVLPTKEDYAKKGDENCDGIPSADTLWVKTLSPTGMPRSSSIAAIATDDAGATYITGSIQGTASLGSATITDTAFLAKLDCEGKFVWATPFPPSAAQASPQLSNSTRRRSGCSCSARLRGWWILRFDDGGFPRTLLGRVRRE